MKIGVGFRSIGPVFTEIHEFAIFPIILAEGGYHTYERHYKQGTCIVRYSVSIGPFRPNSIGGEENHNYGQIISRVKSKKRLRRKP